MRLDYTTITRTTKQIHGGISYVVTEQIRTISGTLYLVASEFRLRGECEVVVTTRESTEQTPVGGNVSVSNPPCQTCNGCPQCDAYCDKVQVCSTVTCRIEGTAEASVYCGTVGTDLYPTTGVNWSAGTMGTPTGSCSVSGCWPCDSSEVGPCAYFDAEASCASYLGGPLPPISGYVWSGCVEDGDGLDVFNQAMNSYQSETFTQQGDPVVSYVVYDDSIGSPPENPQNIRCMVGPDPPPPPGESSFPYHQVNCSSTYFQEIMSVGSLVVV